MIYSKRQGPPGTPGTPGANAWLDWLSVDPTTNAYNMRILAHLATSSPPWGL